MDFAKHYEICSPGVIAENFDGDIVILNLEDGRYFSLRGAGPSVWNALVAGATPQSIFESAARQRPSLADATRQFICKLSEMQLIRTVDSSTQVTGTASVDWISVKDADTPEIEVFDDLAELILADPVHDVDASEGWPVRKAA